jgi:hypothetical protein
MMLKPDKRDQQYWASDTDWEIFFLPQQFYLHPYKPLDIPILPHLTFTPTYIPEHFVFRFVPSKQKTKKAFIFLLFFLIIKENECQRTILSFRCISLKLCPLN